jgi:hypothetical protein
LGCELIDQSICQRVAVRNAEFQDIHAALVKGQGQFLCSWKVRITGSDVHDEALLSAGFQVSESLDNAIHAGAEFPGSARSWQGVKRDP